jgi:hypothetical protein
MTSCRSSSLERSTARAVPKLAENDDEQVFIPGPALTGSGEFCLFNIENNNNSCRGEHSRHSFFGGSVYLQTLS